MDPEQLRDRMPQTAFAFRGYNVTNLGRSHELLADPRYHDIVEANLRRAGESCSEVTGRRVNLVSRIRQQRKTTLRSYGEAIALIVGMECAHLDILDECYGIRINDARFTMGYSLGEISALVAGGVMNMDQALRVPVSLARDCAELADDVTLGIVFSRGPALPLEAVERLCLELNREGNGVIGISAILSPNSVLVLGQGGTVEAFSRRVREDLGRGIMVRKNQHRWPPMHTPIVWQRHIPDRASQMMHTLDVTLRSPVPRVLSLVTGSFAYNELNAREILRRWTCEPQRLWDVMYECLSQGVETVVHVGPEPNIIPATFERLQVDVDSQTRGRIGMRALSAVVRRPWLSAMLPQRTALLRAPLVRQLVLEDWLLDEPALSPPSRSSA